MLLLCYPKCTTCRRAKEWLDANGLVYDERDIKKDNPTDGEIREWLRLSGVPLKKFFNTSGNSYKLLGLKDKLPNITEDEQIALLASDGMLVKRPLLVSGGSILIGFKEKEWGEVLLGG